MPLNHEREGHIRLFRARELLQASSVQASSATRPIVTFSFDDGHSDDLKVAERLARIGAKASFYVAFNDPQTPEISPAEIRELQAMGHEIGSHTLTHRVLVTLPPAEIDREIGDSKARLEDLTRGAITALSYPLGYCNRSVLRSMRTHGYRLGRTQARFHIERDFDPLRMPVSVEFFPHPQARLVKHLLRDLDARAAANWFAAGLASDPLAQARALFDKARAVGGVFHVTARSWEIERDSRWAAFDALLDLVSGDNEVDYLTNSAAAGAA